MSAATEYAPRHAGGIDDECTSGHIPRHDLAASIIRHDLAASIIRDLINPASCWRCSGGMGATCDPCNAEIQMRDDDEAHANECARYDFAQSALADDERDES